jgi:VanZ family protein
MRPIAPVVVAALIVYGSLFPFHFTAPADFRTSLETLLADRQLWTSLSDVLGNVALFVPFGITAAWWAAPRVSRRYAILWALLAGLALAFFLQVGQIFVPERSVAMADVLWNGVGTLLGAAIGLVIETPTLTLGRRVEPPSLVVLGLLALWIVSELAPLVPTWDIGGIKRSLEPLLMDPQLDPAATFYIAARALLVARLLVALVGLRRGASVFPLFAGAVLIGKLFVVDQTLELATVAGLTIAVATWTAWTIRFEQAMASRTLLVLLVLAYSVQELSPFTLRASPSSFSWIPFATSLEGSMLANVRALTASIFSLAGCVWLIGSMGTRIWIAAIPLAFWVLLLESAQRWITGRTASITDSLLVLSAAWLMRQTAPHSGIGVRIVEPAPKVSDRPTPWRAARLRAPSLMLAAAVAAIALGIGVTLRLPGVPYNVLQLFLDHGSALALTIFAFALIWVGAGSMLLAHWLALSKRPFLVLPVGVVIASMVSRTLLKYSVTYESLDDILGSNNLFVQVTSGNIWGEFWRHAFLAANAPNLVAYFERRIRYIALYSPIVVCLALAMLPIARSSGNRTAKSWLQFSGLVASAIAWLWLSKAFLINWAATDNLTELIGQRGPFGLGGGPFLYLIVVMTASNVALLIGATDRLVWWPIAIVFSIIAIPVGWVLLGAGLEQHIEKYGLDFSGTQFLLGPDRQHTLSNTALFMRWAVVDGGVVTVLFIGSWIAHRFAVPAK